MKYFIDLGAYHGQTLERALAVYPDFDLFYAFEPYRESFKILCRKFQDHPKVKLFCAAATVNASPARLYLHHEIGTRMSAAQGNSLVMTKKNVDPDRFEEVEGMGLPEFILDHFRPSDHLVLKMDVEGAEYDLLEAMIENGSIRYVDDLFCEWHYQNGVSVGEERHRRLVQRLRESGLSVAGDNRYDEFSRVFLKTSPPEKAAGERTSFHRLSGYSYHHQSPAKQALWRGLNLMNNLFPGRHLDPELRIADFAVEDIDAQLLRTDLCASPTRKLSDLFLRELPWERISTELGKLRVMDIGCGRGGYCERLLQAGGAAIHQYVGVDSEVSPSWNEVRGRFIQASFIQADCEELCFHRVKQVNFYLSVSVLEHLDRDLRFFERLRDHLVRFKKNALQVHLIPSERCLGLYPFHGLRQYTPRTVSKITRLFSGFSESILYRLGGDHCNQVHDQYVNRSRKLGLKRNQDLRYQNPEQYTEDCHSAIKEDMKTPQAHPSFYALVIHSFGNERLF